MIFIFLKGLLPPTQISLSLSSCKFNSKDGRNVKAEIVFYNFPCLWSSQPRQVTTMNKETTTLALTKIVGVNGTVIFSESVVHPRVGLLSRESALVEPANDHCLEMIYVSIGNIRMLKSVLIICIKGQ